MKILVSYRGIPQSRGWATGDSVVRAFNDLGHDAHAYSKYYQRDNEWIEDPTTLEGERWDLILFMECNDTEPIYYELFDQARFPCRQFATWYFDVAMSPGYLSSWQSLVAHRPNDQHFVANPSSPKGLLGMQPERTHFLPYAADVDLHVRNDVEKKYDFTLVGSDRPERRELIASLQAAGINARLISDVYREDYIDTLAASCVSICDVAGGGGGMLPMRVFEAPAAGSMLLTLDGQGAEKIFDLTAAYYQPGELKHACLRYISDWGRVEIMAEAGQQHILRHHTYEKRCEFILETCFG